MSTNAGGLPRTIASMVTLMAMMSVTATAAEEILPKVGDTATDFELTSVAGEKVRLSEAAKNGPVVLIVLRGFPGYQCPICNRQVGQFLAAADKFKLAGASVVFVYPGPSKNLGERAKEFLKDQTIPPHFQLLMDPDYSLVNSYHLRWDAPRETAYPSTFVIRKDRRITFAKISREHGGRTSVDEVLKSVNEGK